MQEARGTCRVMCFHPKSNKTIPVMALDEIRAVIDRYVWRRITQSRYRDFQSKISAFIRWIEQQDELGQKFEWVQIFENKGAVMGCSNPHPHCQIWASSFLPNEPRIKNEMQHSYFLKHGRPLLMDYMKRECEKKVWHISHYLVKTLLIITCNEFPHFPGRTDLLWKMNSG